jgi:hypothetical protein
MKSQDYILTLFDYIGVFEAATVGLATLSFLFRSLTTRFCT